MEVGCVATGQGVLAARTELWLCSGEPMLLKLAVINDMGGHGPLCFVQRSHPAQEARLLSHLQTRRVAPCVCMKKKMKKMKQGGQPAKDLAFQIAALNI